MLMSDKGNIVVNGNKTDIMADLATLLNNIYKREVLTEEEVVHCNEIAKWSDEKLDEEVEKAEKELKADIKSGLMEMLDNLFS